MPDHLHLVVRGQPDGNAPKRVMEAFKRDSSMWLAEHRPGIFWQKDFHDRILRYNETSATIRYFALNPVLAGLAEDINAWPFTGTIGYDLNEVLQDAFWEQKYRRRRYRCLQSRGPFRARLDDLPQPCRPDGAHRG